jgi:hypothetical protein
MSSPAKFNTNRKMRYGALSILVLLVFAACQKQEPELGYRTGTTGTATMTIGKKQIAFPVKSLELAEGKYGIHFGDYQLALEATLSLSFNNLNLTLARQQTGRSSTSQPYSYMFTNGDDEIREEYLLDKEDTPENYIQFTEINREQGKLKGIFKGTYAINVSRGCRYFDLSDTVRITDGRFDLKTMRLP